MKSIHDIKTVLYHNAEEENPLVQRFLSLEGVNFVSYSDEKDLNAQIKILREGGALSKEVVICREFMGRFFQICPGSPSVVCCNYRVINSCFNCLFNCTYCYLNSYLNAFGIVQFTNVLDVLEELYRFYTGLDDTIIYRIGTGEFTDSLVMDELTGIGTALIERMSDARNLMMELKTKSNNIDHLLAISEKGNAVISWSLNTERNIARYEKGTASLKDRLDAAARAAAAGFFVAFHFDPVILYDGWQHDYCSVIEKLFQTVDERKIVWISLGTFRYSPGFKDIIRNRFPEEDLTLQEMFPGPDGKVRYFKKKRVEVYKMFTERISEHSKKPFVYLCMEFDYIWQEVFGKRYQSSEELEKDFSDHLKREFLTGGCAPGTPLKS